jgi:hypothetical protein
LSGAPRVPGSRRLLDWHGAANDNPRRHSGARIAENRAAQGRAGWQAGERWKPTAGPSPVPSEPRQQRPAPAPHREPSKTAVNVTASTPLAAGKPVQAQWGGSYFQAEVLEVLPDDRVRIHYVGWSTNFDETVPRAKLWIEPPDADEQVAAADVEPGEATSRATGQPPENDETIMRTWTDSTGKHHVEAEFLELDNGKVRLKRRDGKEVVMPLGRLSPADQQFVRTQTNADSQLNANER